MTPKIIGVPMDWGASKRGASGGPAAIRRANLMGALSQLDLPALDLGDVPIPPVPKRSLPKFKNAAAILKVCRELQRRVYEAVKAAGVPVVLGGDHSLAAGTVSGAARALKERGAKMGLIWADAHADMNTPQTTPSGNIHGMPLAHLLGLGDKSLNGLAGFRPAVGARNACIIGARDVDKSEAQSLRRLGIRVFSMQEIDRFGMGTVIEQALELASDGTAGFYLSFDIDVVDPGLAPGTGTVKRGGLTYRESHLLMELAHASGMLLGLDLVEVNPLEDTHNATAELAVELICSAMGKRIY